MAKLSFKHGFFGALFFTLLGALALEYAKQFLPHVFGIFGKIGTGISDFLLERASIVLDPKLCEISVFVFFISLLFLLGQMFIRSRSGRED